MLYDKFARVYDRAFAPMERGFLGRWRAETFAELPAGGDLLEIGAGTGANFKLYPRHKLAAASEPSSKMLDAARPKIRGQQLVQADAQQLPFGDNTFDAAVGTLVFCTIPEPLTALGELRRVVRPEGRVLLLEHVRPDGFPGYAFDVLSVFTAALIGDHFNRRTAELAELSGLKVVDVRRHARGVVNLIICKNAKPGL